MAANETAVLVRRERRAAGAPSRLMTLGIMAVTAIMLAGAAYLANRPSGGDVTKVDLLGTATGPAPVVGQAAPGFTAKLVDGTALSLADLKGKAVWLTFGASWCQPCRSEAADIEAAYEAFAPQGVVVVQAFMQEDQVAVKDYADRVGLTYRTIPDPATTLSGEYRILGIPTHFFIGRDGVLRQIRVGTMTLDDMKSTLAQIAG